MPKSANLQAKIIATEASSDEPLWSIDLHTMGLPISNRALQWQRGLGSFDTVDFLSDGVVAATFITEEPATGLQKRDDPNRRRPYRLHAIFLDAATGTILKTLEWYGDNLQMGIFPRFDGRFLFFSTEHIVLYSADWKPVKELPLPVLQLPNAALKQIAESPSGNVLELRIRRNQSLLCLRILTDSLDVANDTCSTLLGFSVSDDGIAATDTNSMFNLSGEPGDANREVQYRNSGQPRPADPYARVELLLDRGDRKEILCDTISVKSCWKPQFVSNDMVVVYANGLLSLLNLSGVRAGEHPELEFEKLFVRIQKKGSGANRITDSIAGVGRPIRPSANGQRFAVPLNAPTQFEGGKVPDDLSVAFLPAMFPDEVEVFDIPTGLRADHPELQCRQPNFPCDWMIYKLANKDHQFKQIWGLGLSPTGEKLVIDSGGVIQAYTIPEPEAAPMPKKK